MPRWASRITLRVESIRCERLQDITPEEALSEGIPGNAGRFVAGLGGQSDDFLRKSRHVLAEFVILWDQINLKRAPWANNPWVWRVEFSRVLADKART